MKRYLKDDYVPEDAIPSWESLYEKTAAVEKIRRLYMKNFWTFTYYHNALFHMFSMEDLAFCLTNPIEAKYYGDGAKYFASRRKFLTLYFILLQYQEPHFGPCPSPLYWQAMLCQEMLLTPGSSCSWASSWSTRATNREELSCPECGRGQGTSCRYCF